MGELDTVVLTKGVPDFREGQVSFDEDGHLERGKTPTVMNPNDKHALRAALQTRVRHGGTVSVMSMGPPGYRDVLREAMETVYADDLTLVSDREMAAADTWATAITLGTGRIIMTMIAISAKTAAAFKWPSGIRSRIST